jgi:hypothetical protein
MKRLTCSLAITLLCAMVVGCPQFLQNLGGDIAGDVSESALNYDGTVTGCVLESSSTTASQDDQAAQRAALGPDAVCWLTDLEGNPLLDAEGNEYPVFPVNPDGTFDLGSLPVGVDIVLVIDVDGDGEADLFTIINIPKDADADSGTLDDVTVDPLSTVTRARLQHAIALRSQNYENLDVGLAGVIGRTRDAYEHLFEDAGIDHGMLLNDIRGLVSAELSDFFDNQVPVAAQRGMRMAFSNIALADAEEVEDVVAAAAQLLVEGGFVIADEPGGIDLSFLGDLPHVVALTFEQFEELFAMQDPGEPPPARRVPRKFKRTAQTAVDEPVLYVSDVVEADRNYAMAEEGEQPYMPKPMFGEGMLTDMANMYMERKTITLRNLHYLLVDAERGLGVRLAYSLWNGPNEAPTEVFESPDGTGVVVDMQALFEELEPFSGDPGFDPMAAQTTSVRDIIADFLAGTAEPTFQRLFGGILMERVPDADEFARYIRNRRVHVPFSRYGPATWFVVADADPWQDPNAAAITVDVETDAGGDVTAVTYNPTNDGDFYLRHGPLTETGMQVELIRLGNGRMLHNHGGEPQFLEMSDNEIFQPVDGESFFEAFSETGLHWPGAPALLVPNYDFDPALPPDPETNPPEHEVFVLMTSPTPDAVPVRVNYADGVATYAPDGTYYMAFDEQTDLQGLFALVSQTGEMLADPPGAGWDCRVLADAEAVVGIDLAPQEFTYVYGVEVGNAGYDPEGAPYYDDINNNGQWDEREPTFAQQFFLADPADWRSTWVERYYRRADNNGFPAADEIDWESETPALLNGVALVPRQFRARLNAFLYGRPNSALNLLMAFCPPEFFDGTQAIDEDTPVNPLMAVALIDLVFEQTMNVEATVDWDGPGGMPPHLQLLPAWFFIAPVDDPVALIAENFESLAE